jgi:hypothetical protein
MTAQVRFTSLLQPVLSGVDDARTAAAATRILRAGGPRDIDVVPLGPAAALTQDTIYAVRGDSVEWHAVRLLIEQGKLGADARVPVRIFLNAAQWRRAGLVARLAEAAHRIAVPLTHRIRIPPPELGPRDLIRWL